MIAKIACLLIALASVSGIALANDIYKWTDADGNVHYGDRPSGDASEERVAISSRPTDPGKVRTQLQARRTEIAATKEEKAAQDKAAGESEQEQKALAKERAEKCETYKARLQKFVTSRRLYRQDESGERVYLDEAEMRAARERVENQVQEYCSS